MIRTFFNFALMLALLSVLFTVGCTAQQTEEQALRSLREMTSNGKLPPEDIVARIESRFAGKRTGALAKLLHARIRFEAGDFAGAAAMLNTDVFRKKTKVADHALWLRGKALQAAGNNVEAMNVFAELFNDFPDSVKVRDAKLLWAQSAIATGKAAQVASVLSGLDGRDGDALLLTAKAHEAQGAQSMAVKFYRAAYFYAAGSAAAKEAEAKLRSLSESLTPENDSEAWIRANKFFETGNYKDAAAAYSEILSNSPKDRVTPDVQLKWIEASAKAGKMTDAQSIFNSLPSSAKEREEGYRQLVLGYAKSKLWQQARTTADEMRQKFPAGNLAAKTFVDAGLAARDAKNRVDEAYFLNTAVSAFPNAVDVAQAQFETAWYQHENNNFALSSQMFIDHLARYADKDTTNRGKAGYWAGRDSERAGKLPEACAMYDGVIYRYGSNWYGYLALGRLTVLKNQGKCSSTAPPNETVARAVSNLKIVTVAAETAGESELARAAKGEELSTVGLFDWAIDELQAAKKTALNSPTINLALAKHYRLKGDNTAALLALAKSYPDYAQMFPEELGREEWEIFYPLTNWNEIKTWAQNRGLDRYQVAGFIRQETIFDPKAKSGANAYGLMQLLLPTAKTVARTFGASIMPTSAEDLYQPGLNIELGTAYLKQQFTKFGRLEYVAVAYNAGPGRVPQWRSSLPAEMDEFVEAIPFKETKGYVQGIIRNSAQYRRLYDDNGHFKANVGARPLRGEIDSKPRDQFTAEFPEVIVDDDPHNG